MLESGGFDFSEATAGVGLPELQRTIRAAAHADFATGDVADLEGWQLARTEARLAALFTVTRLSG